MIDSSEDLALALQVLQYPAPELNQRASQVFNFDGIKETVRAMRFTALLNNASFLSATQVKISSRIIFVPAAGYAFVNPNIVEQSKQEAITQINCVSFPNKTFTVKRATTIKIQTQNEHGDRMLETVEGLAAIQTQIAIEYLNGQTLASDLTWQDKLKIHWTQWKSYKKTNKSQPQIIHPDWKDSSHKQHY